jgi:hypothetical protein
MLIDSLTGCPTDRRSVAQCTTRTTVDVALKRCSEEHRVLSLCLFIIAVVASVMCVQLCRR